MKLRSLTENLCACLHYTDLVTYTRTHTNTYAIKHIHALRLTDGIKCVLFLLLVMEMRNQEEKMFTSKNPVHTKQYSSPSDFHLEFFVFRFCFPRSLSLSTRRTSFKRWTRAHTHTHTRRMFVLFCFVLFSLFFWIQSIVTKNKILSIRFYCVLGFFPLQLSSGVVVVVFSSLKNFIYRTH